MRLALPLAAVAAAATLAHARPGAPLPSTVGLRVQTRPVRDACVAETRIITVGAAGDPAPLVAALTTAPIRGLDFDPANPQHAQRSTRRFAAWFKAAQDRYERALDVELRAFTAPGATVDVKLGAVVRAVHLRSQFAYLLRALEIPRSVRAIPDGRRAFCEALDEQAQALDQAADEARQRCRELVASAGLGAGPWTTTCAATAP